MLEGLIKEPAADPIDKIKTFSQVQSETKAEKFAAAAAALEIFKQSKTK